MELVLNGAGGTLSGSGTEIDIIGTIGCRSSAGFGARPSGPGALVDSVEPRSGATGGCLGTSTCSCCGVGCIWKAGCGTSIALGLGTGGSSGAFLGSAELWPDVDGGASVCRGA